MQGKYRKDWQGLVHLGGPKLTVDQIGQLLRQYGLIDHEGKPTKEATGWYYFEGLGWHKDRFLYLRTQWRRAQRRERRRHRLETGFLPLL